MRQPHTASLGQMAPILDMLELQVIRDERLMLAARSMSIDLTREGYCGVCCSSNSKKTGVDLGQSFQGSGVRRGDLMESNPPAEDASA